MSAADAGVAHELGVHHFTTQLTLCWATLIQTSRSVMVTRADTVPFHVRTSNASKQAVKSIWSMSGKTGWAFGGASSGAVHQARGCHP